MAERRRRPDLDERFSLDGDPEDVLRRLLAPDEAPPDDEEDSAAPEDS